MEFQKSSLIAVLVLSLTGCTLCKQKDKEYVDRVEYIFPHIPDPLLEPVDKPTGRQWTLEDLQGEDAGTYITQLNLALDKANERLKGIKIKIEDIKKQYEHSQLQDSRDR